MNWKISRACSNDGIDNPATASIMREDGTYVIERVLIDDARLIAAAPDLLTALRYAAEMIEKHNDEPEYELDFIELAGMLRAAIAKAEGGQK